MGDPLSIYWQVLGGLSHILLWTRGPSQSECICRCETERLGTDTCSVVIKEVVGHCLETVTTQTLTTTPHSTSWPFLGWWILWILFFTFCCGFGIGAGVAFSWAGRPRARPIPSIQVQPVSEGAAAARPRRGVEA